ncbi:MAG: YeeE/YedE family protein [Candidatus Magnetoovum sp. WYHC-5]|nr:YeeE/YedE family protein [Candidatus Magnetoovum sp. WYHC-5]
MWEEFISRLSHIFLEETIGGFAGPTQLYGGFIIGLIFGIVLQKGRACKYDVVTGLFRLNDFTIFRIGAPLIMVAMFLLFLFKDFGIIELQVPKTIIFPQILGGLLFGAAIAIVGYCPGTAAGALGEGMLDSIPAMLGMIAGSVFYAEFFYSSWGPTLQTWGDVGRDTFADMIGVNPWFVIILFILMTTMFLIMTTFVDWFIIFMKKLFNTFFDMTDAIEVQTEGTREKTASFIENVKAAVKKKLGGKSSD